MVACTLAMDTRQWLTLTWRASCLIVCLSAKTALTAGCSETETLELSQRYTVALEELAVHATGSIMIDVPSMPWAKVGALIASCHVWIVHGIATRTHWGHMGHDTAHGIKVGSLTLIDGWRLLSGHCCHQPVSCVKNADLVEDSRLCVSDCCLRARHLCADLSQASACEVELVDGVFIALGDAQEWSSLAVVIYG